MTERLEFSALKEWLKENGGGFHGKSSGNAVVASEDISENSTIVSCPFSLIITEELAQHNISKLFPTKAIIDWTERQWISTYICLHWILAHSKLTELAHYPYINTFPPVDQLRSSLHFTEVELQAFRGSNLYHATLDRTQEWKEEWRKCQAVLENENTEWGKAFAWEKYLAAATYISSRAFPSSLLSPTPTLKTTSSTKPVLLPGVDSLNHRRGQPVSWSVNYPAEGDSTEPTISIILHNKTPAGHELFNNYGPKPNSELILGYGFSLANNPDDTILLKIAGLEGRKWEIGRDARGVESLWYEILNFLSTRGKDDEEGEKELYEDQLDAAEMLMDMVQTLLDKLPSETAHENPELRPDVATMMQHYVEGQREILQALLGFCQQKEAEAIELARSLGIELVIEG